MKKLTAILLTVMMTVALTACGSKTGETGKEPAADSNTSTDSATPNTDSNASDTDSSSTDANSEKGAFTLKITTEQAETESFGQLIAMLADRIEEYTDGQVVCEIYYNGELAKPADACEAISQGANMMTFATMDFYASHVHHK